MNDSAGAQADLRKLAVEQVQAAVGGRNQRGEQETMLRIESQVPGFGGFYLDGGGEVVALMKAMPGYSAAHVRNVLASTYAEHGNPLVRQIMAPASRARIIPADYSLSELIAIEQLISRNSRSMQVGPGSGRTS